MTDQKAGYDIKVIRSGLVKLDTTYSYRACKPTKLGQKYRYLVPGRGWLT